MKYSILFMVDFRNKLRMVVRYMGKRMFYNLFYSVDKDKWNKDSQRCKRNTTHGDNCTPASKINNTIQQYEDAVIKVANSFTSEPSYSEFKAALDKELKRDAKKVKDITEGETDFFRAYNEYIKEQSSLYGWGYSMALKHRTVLREWKQFDPNMTIAKINSDTLNKFVAFQIQIGHQNETSNKKLSMSKWFFRWLVSHGRLDDVSFTTYRTHLKTANKNVVFLTWDELMRVYNHQFEVGGCLDKVRDVFCFCCFSSLRYSDVRNLAKKDIYDDALHIVTQKTNDMLTIELNDYTKEILHKYRDFDGEKALPVVSNQKMNVYIKEVCKQCELNDKLTNIYYVGRVKHEVTKEKWQMIGTHCGRRTFICNALMLGIAPNVVMKWTGHSDYKSMQPYIDIADEAKQKAMSLFNKKSDK